MTIILLQLLGLFLITFYGVRIAGSMVIIISLIMIPKEDRVSLKGDKVYNHQIFLFAVGVVLLCLRWICT